MKGPMIYSELMNILKVQSGGHEVPGYLFSNGMSPEVPLIILLPGSTGAFYLHRERTDWLELAHQLFKAGYRVLLFEFRGQGRSPGSYSVHNSLADIKAFVDSCASADFNDSIERPERIGIWGLCSGALVGLYHARYDKRIKSIGTWELSSQFQYTIHRSEWFRKEFNIRTDPQSFFIPYQAGDIIGEITQPILIAGGDTNRDAKVYDLSSLHAKTRNGRLKILSGAEHRVDPSHTQFREYVDLCIEWFRQTL